MASAQPAFLCPIRPSSTVPLAHSNRQQNNFSWSVTHCNHCGHAHGCAEQRRCNHCPTPPMPPDPSAHSPLCLTRLRRLLVSFSSPLQSSCIDKQRSRHSCRVVTFGRIIETSSPPSSSWRRTCSWSGRGRATRTSPRPPRSSSSRAGTYSEQEKVRREWRQRRI